MPKLLNKCQLTQVQLLAVIAASLGFKTKDVKSLKITKPRSGDTSYQTTIILKDGVKVDDVDEVLLAQTDSSVAVDIPQESLTEGRKAKKVKKVKKSKKSKTDDVPFETEKKSKKSKKSKKKGKKKSKK